MKFLFIFIFNNEYEKALKNAIEKDKTVIV